jgi:predicted nucleotidyltransferase
MLALEYVRAIDEYGLNLDIYPIKRENNYNSTRLDGKFCSASAIRNAINESINYSEFVPDFNAINGNAKPDFALFEKIALFQLRMQNENAALLASSGEGLENKLIKNATTAVTLLEAQEKTKSKRYTFARIKRLTLDNLLKIKKDDLVFPDNATAILLAVKNAFLPYLKPFSPFIITENSQLENFIPRNFVEIEERSEKLYSTLCSTNYNGVIKKLVKV